MVIPKKYASLSPEQKKKICNGCGAKGGIDVPDTMFGLSVTESCDIHDFMWHSATNLEELKSANSVFYTNMKMQIKAGSWFFRWLRNRRAYEYYLAVKYIGTKSYARERGFIT